MPGKLAITQGLLVVTIIGAGLWGATQWVAAMLGERLPLGSPWFALAGWPVYHPWRLFQWWYLHDADAPWVFERAGLLAAGAGLLGAATAIAGSLLQARQGRSATTYGSARWATRSEIARAGLLARRGVLLGCHRGRYLRHDGPEHVIALAPTRSGKGVGLVIPTLLSWTGSAVIHDIKGENWRLTAGWRAQFSHCLLFNPTDPDSTRYNPLLEVRKGRHEVRDVQNIADILVDPEGALERRNHWEKTSHALLVGVILHVLYAEADKSLSRVAALLSDPQRSFEHTLRAMMATNHLGSDAAPQAHPVVAAVARDLLNKSDNERSGVLSTATSFLALYRDPLIAAMTSSCDWRINDLVDADKPVSLYLVIPPSDISRSKPLVRLVLNQIGRRLTEQLTPGQSDGGSAAAPVQMLDRAGGRKHQLLLMLDEFPALGRLDFFETTLSFMAGYGIRAYLIAQSLNQITKAYGENSAILDNCHIRITFACNDERTARRISDALGTATEQRLQRNYAGHRLSPWLSHVVVARQESARPLLTPGEVMQLPADEALILVSGLYPIRARKLRYFADLNFVNRVLPPPAPGLPPQQRQPLRPHHDDWSGQRSRPDPRLATAIATTDLDLLGDDAADGMQHSPGLDPGAAGGRADPVADDLAVLDEDDLIEDFDGQDESAPLIQPDMTGPDMTRPAPTEPAPAEPAPAEPAAAEPAWHRPRRPAGRGRGRSQG